MIDVLLGVAVASSGLLLALNISKENQLPEDRWLQGWLWAYLLMSLGFLSPLFFNELWQAISVALSTSLIFMGGPFLYFYAKAAAQEKVPLRWLHFIPAVANFSISVLLLFTGAVEASELGLHLNFDLTFIEVMILKPLPIFLSMVYPWLAIKAVARRRELLKENLSDIENKGLLWVNLWAWSSILLLMGLLVSGLMNFFGGLGYTPYIIFIQGLFCAQLLYVGFRGLKQSDVFGATVHNHPTLENTPPQEIDRLDIDKLADFMAEEKPYLKPGITISEFAGELGWDVERVSSTLKFGIKESYFDLINRYRVDEVKYQLSQPGNKNVTLLALAMDAGFGSKSAFNEAFLKHTGLTPSAYRKTLIL